MSEHIKVWQCTGCGRIEGQQNCVGICKDSHIELVHAEDHEQLRRELEKSRAEAAALTTCMHQIIGVRPRNGEWERCFHAAQEHLLRGLTR